MFKLIAAIVDFALAALNVGLAIKSGNPVAWAAAIFCFSVGIVVLTIG